MTQRVLAPWSRPQVASIQNYQDSPDTATLTCLASCPAGTQLQVTPMHLGCPSCSYRQMWVYGDIADGTWVARRLQQQLDAAVAEWHGSGSTTHLHEWLGMTWDQYGTWMRDNVVPEGYHVPDRTSSPSGAPATPVSPGPSS